MKYLIAILMLSVGLNQLSAQNGYFVSFTDKNDSPYSINAPETFLSERAIERRVKQNIAISESDLPVNPKYIDSLRNAGIEVRHTTKWLNGAIVFSADQNLMDTLDRVSFIKAVDLTKPTQAADTRKKLETNYPLLKSGSSDQYGAAWSQIRTVNGHKLHQQNYTGHGIQIAIIDAGFYKVDELPLFGSLWDKRQILGTKDFVNPASDIFNEHYHGMNVLSIIGGQLDNEYLGTAPDASFWLLRTEDVHSEHPIEPDYWICAAEFADSVGVDIINTSLGYYEFDSPSKDYTYNDLNASTRVSRASDIASSKGMLIITSAGNEGNGSWRYIGTPADAKHCIAVGAMTADSIKAGFSSFGPTADGRVKPDITAQGVAVAVQNSSDGISNGNGTSFSAPVVSGLAACLWQAMPDKSAAEIRDLIIKSGHQYTKPDDKMGYGIANFQLAYHVNVNDMVKSDFNWKVSPNPFSQYLNVTGNNKQNITISIYDVLGNLKYQKEYYNTDRVTVNNIAHFAKGIYIVSIKSQHLKHHVKVIKSH